MIAAIEARLALLGALKLVSGAASFASAAENRPAALPAAYVLPLQEAAGENALGCGVAQIVKASFGIALAVSNVADAKGREAMAGLGELRLAAGPQLLGWSPADGCSPLEFGGGSLLGFKNGVLWWQDIYSTEFVIKA